MSYPYGKIFITDFVPSILSPQFPGATLRNLYVHYIKPLFAPSSPMFLQADFLSHFPTDITSVERMHRSSCRVITGCLSSTPIPLLYLEALLPPLCITFTHQSLSFFESSLRPSSFPLDSLVYSNPCTCLKKASCRSFSHSHNLTPNLQLSRKPLILFLPKPPWSIPSSYSISHQLSSPCSHDDPPSFATSLLLSIYPLYPTTTSLPGLIAGSWWAEREGGAGIHIKCTKCLTATSLSLSAGLWATSYSAKTDAILHALEWCIYYSMSCVFRSVTLFSDSLSVLTILSAPVP